jgi:hypothetical protein
MKTKTILIEARRSMKEPKANDLDFEAKTAVDFAVETRMHAVNFQLCEELKAAQDKSNRL